MKKVLLILLLLLPFVFAFEFPQYQDKYVNDFGKMFTSEQVDSLRAILSEVEKNTTAQVVVVTVDTTEPYVPSEYRTKLFNEWKIGDKEKDNGLLIVYAVKEERIEVEVGYGLEGILPDSKVGRYLDDYYVPLRDENKTDEGIILFTQNIVSVINSEYDSSAPVVKKGLSTWQIVAILIFMIIFFIVISMAFQKGVKKANQGKGGNDWSPFIGFGGLGGGGFSGGSSGGFGGGSSGGGGAGR